MSPWMPAPPPESDPAMISTRPWKSVLLFIISKVNYSVSGGGYFLIVLRQLLHFEQYVARYGSRRRCPAAAMLDGNAAGVFWRIGRREADEQRVMAEFPRQQI